MPPPTAQQALRALEIQELHGIHARKTADGWVVETSKRQRLKAAGIHETAHAALLAGESAIQAGEGREREARALAALDGLQTAAYYPIPRDLENGERRWDILRLDGTASAVTGRPSVVQALEDAAEAAKRGAL